MIRSNSGPHHEDDRALDRAIRAVLAEPPPDDVKNRVLQTALGWADSQPDRSRNGVLKNMLILIRTHKRVSGAVATVAAACAAGFALLLLLSPVTTRAYTLEETLQANRKVTSYHVKFIRGGRREAWVELGPDGTPLRAREDFQDIFDGPKVVLLNRGRARVWFQLKESLVIIPEADALERMVKLREFLDPRLTFERLQADKAAGKVQVAAREPARDGEPIVLDVTSQGKPDRKEVYEVDPQAKLVQEVTVYRRSGDNWEQLYQRQYVDYNAPIDPRVFEPEIPPNVTVYDQISQTPGLAKGDLTEDAIAKQVVRAFFEALIARDYARAGLLYGSMPEKKVEEVYGKRKYIRIVEIGQPTEPDGWLFRVLNRGWPIKQVPTKIEIEFQGRREIKDVRPVVRQLYGQTDRRVISGGF